MSVQALPFFGRAAKLLRTIRPDRSSTRPAVKGKVSVSQRGVISLILALAILVSAVLRPPGTMVTIGGGVIRVELCTVDNPEMMILIPDGSGHSVDLGCDFFSGHVAMEAAVAPEPVPVALRLVTELARLERQHTEPLPWWQPYGPRDPPLAS
jgi:hypothetical protein